MDREPLNVVTPEGQRGTLNMTQDEFVDLQRNWAEATASVGRGPGLMNRIRALGHVFAGVFNGGGVRGAVENLRFVRRGEVEEAVVEDAPVAALAVVETAEVQHTRLTAFRFALSVSELIIEDLRGVKSVVERTVELTLESLTLEMQDIAYGTAVVPVLA